MILPHLVKFIIEVNAAIATFLIVQLVVVFFSRETVIP